MLDYIFAVEVKVLHLQLFAVSTVWLFLLWIYNVIVVAAFGVAVQTLVQKIIKLSGFLPATSFSAVSWRCLDCLRLGLFSYVAFAVSVVENLLCSQWIGPVNEILIYYQLRLTSSHSYYFRMFLLLQLLSHALVFRLRAVSISRIQTISLERRCNFLF